MAVAQTSGRERLNIHGALDLETGKTAMIEVECVDAASTIRLLQTIESRYPRLARIHVFLDNARYHYAVLVREWLAQPGRRIRLRFMPSCCPHLNPIERLWGDAQTSHPQQRLTGLPYFRQRRVVVSPRQSPKMLENIPRFGNRQLPRHQSQGFSGSREQGLNHQFFPRHKPRLKTILGYCDGPPD